MEQTCGMSYGRPPIRCLFKGLILVKEAGTTGGLASSRPDQPAGIDKASGGDGSGKCYALLLILLILLIP